MNEFKHMLEEYWPDKSKHIEYSVVYRAVKSKDKLGVNDFLPWNIEHKNQMKTFRNTFKQPQYGMSVFTNLDSLKNTVESVITLNDSTNAYAKGFTTIKRGISQ